MPNANLRLEHDRGPGYPFQRGREDAPRTVTGDWVGFAATSILVPEGVTFDV